MTTVTRTIMMEREGISGRPGRGELQEQRQVVRQLRRRRLVARLLVELKQIDHRLPAVAALAMHVLEEMQG